MAWLAGAASYKPLALLRIGVAAVLLLQAVVLWSHRDLLLVPDGLVPWEVSELWLDPLVPRMSHVAALLAPSGLDAHAAAAVTLALHALAVLFLLFGMGTRAAAAVAWLTFLPIKGTGFLFTYGLAGMALIALFYCVVMPVGRAWSLDARRHPERGRDGDGGALLPVMVLRLHLCIVYAAAGLSKAVGTQWWTGEAVWRALSLPQFQQFDPTPLLAVPALLPALAVTAMLAQLLYPVLVWTRLRVPTVVVAEAIHLGIAAFLGLWLFSAMMMVLNAAAFGESLYDAFRRRPR